MSAPRDVAWESLDWTSSRGVSRPQGHSTDSGALGAREPPRGSSPRWSCSTFCSASFVASSAGRGGRSGCTEAAEHATSSTPEPPFGAGAVNGEGAGLLAIASAVIRTSVAVLLSASRAFRTSDRETGCSRQLAAVRHFDGAPRGGRGDRYRSDVLGRGRKPARHPIWRSVGTRTDHQQLPAIGPARPGNCAESLRLSVVVALNWT